MEIPGATFWWLAAGVLVAIELVTGTFYLLMISLGMAAAAVVAHLGYGPTAQVAAAALVGASATVTWHWRRYRASADAPAMKNRNVNLDIGERVHVAHWTAERTARVQYRGSEWIARLTPDATPCSGAHVVTAVEGNWLVLTPHSLH